MKPTHELHVDLVRLLGATERLVADGEASAGGSWEHWPRFCQFIQSLDDLHSQLQGRMSETLSQPANASSLPSAEELLQYDRRLESLRRKREDLLSAAAAAAAAAAAQENSTPTPSEKGADESTQQRVGASDAGEAHRQSNRPEMSLSPEDRSGSGGLFDGRRVGGRGGSGQDADEAEADQVAQEISSMAGRLKESSMAINQTLRTQTQVLEDTGDAATQNVDRVKRENTRVAERLRKKRAAMFASWCMIIMVIVTFILTYALVILPFDKRRGPFARPRSSTFAQAAEQTAQIPPQQQQQQQQQQQDLYAEEARRRSQEAYEERSRQVHKEQQAFNAGHRLVSEEKEKFRERQAKQMSQNAKERKAARQAAMEAEAKEPGIGGSREDVLDSPAEGVTDTIDPPKNEPGAILEAKNANADDGNSAGEDGGGGEGGAEGSSELGHDSERTARLAAESRRKANEYYAERSRREAEKTQSANAGLRLVAEEKERYRNRHAKRMQEKARKRKAERYAESQEDSLKARAIDGSSTVTFSDGGEGAENAESGTESAEHLPVGEVEEKDEEASGAASTFAAENGEAGGVIPPVDREAERRIKEEARLAHEERSRSVHEEQVSQNAGLRLVAEEEEQYRQRQRQGIVERARERKTQEQEGGNSEEPQPSYQEPEDADAPSEGDGSEDSLDAVRKRLRESLGAGKREEEGQEVGDDGRRRDEL